MYSLSSQACSCFATVVASGAPELAVDVNRMSQIRIHAGFSAAAGRWWQMPVLASLSARTTAGICLNDDIFLADRSLLPRWPLLVHELTHWVQYRKSGTPLFLCGYALEFAGRLLRGHDAHQAYMQLSYERQARQVEAFAGRSVPLWPWLLPVLPETAA